MPHLFLCQSLVVPETQIFFRMKPNAMYLPSIRLPLVTLVVVSTIVGGHTSIAQENDTVAPPSAELLQPLIEKRDALRGTVDLLRTMPQLQTRDGKALLADVLSSRKPRPGCCGFRSFRKPNTSISSA